MKRVVCWLLLILFVVAFQGSAAYFMSINGVKPDVVLVFVLLTGVVYGRTQGLVTGFFCGLLVDLLNSGLFGFYTLVLMPVGMVSGMMQKNVFEDNFVLPLIMVAVASFAVNILLLVCVAFSGYAFCNWLGMLAHAGNSVIYNTLITLPILFLFNKMRRKLTDGEVTF